MTCKIPKDFAPPWPACPLDERLKACLLMLTMHDVVTDSIADSIRHKIDRLVKKRAKTDEEKREQELTQLGDPEFGTEKGDA